jgi:hypothetical protein
MNNTLMAGILTWAKQVAALPPCIHNTVFIVASYPRMLTMAFKPSRCTMHGAYFSVGWVEW